MFLNQFTSGSIAAVGERDALPVDHGDEEYT
jgi:hypothetical protein